MRTVVRRCCWILLLGVVACPAWAQQDLAALRKKAESDALRGMRGIKDLGRMSIRQVVKLTPQGGFLRLSTSVPGNGQQYRVSIDEFPGVSTVAASGLGGASGPGHFHFRNHRFDDPECVSVIIGVYASASHVQISVVRQLAVGSQHMLLTQRKDEALMAGGESPVQLFISQNPGGRGPSQRDFSAASFTALIAAHPAEVDEHVRPVLRLLQAESAMAPDPDIALQVFGPTWEPQAATVEQVRRLLAMLEDESYERRGDAARRLGELKTEGALALMQVDRSALSPQQKAVIDSVLAPRLVLTPRQAEELSGDVRFLVDCLYSEHPRIRASALEALRRKLQRDVAFNPDGPTDARLAAVDQLRRQLFGPTTRPAQ